MFEPEGKGTRSTLRLGKADVAARQGEHVLLLPVWIGQHRLAIEATRVVEVVPGAWANPQGDSSVVTADLYRALGVLAPEDRETVLARADSRLGRGPGAFVAFAVDRAQRLVRSPLENLAPLPEIARVQIEVDFLVGVVRMQFPDDGMAFLLDPKRLAASCSRDDARGSAPRSPGELP